MTSGEASPLLDPAASAGFEADTAPCGLAVTDLDGRLVAVNATLLSMIGRAREELVGKGFADLLSRGGQLWYATHYAPLVQLSGAADEIALDLVTADGGRLPVLVNSRVDRSAEEPVVRMAVFPARQRRSYERELLDAKERAEASEVKAIRLARTLQETLIPPTPPRIPGLTIATGYRPAGDGSEVGGDFYDIFQIGPGDWAITMGDVCGKGVEAAVVTALVRYTLRAAAVEHVAPSAALRVLNQVMISHGTERFCTVVMLRLRVDGPQVHCVVTSAGHPLPLLRTGAGSVQEVGVPGTLVGVISDANFHDAEVVLEPGDRLLAFTDGVIEARQTTALYGGQRLSEVLAADHPGIGAVVDRLIEDVLAFQDGYSRDDVAVVGIEVPA